MANPDKPQTPTKKGRGGKRAGAGRKRDRLPDEVVKRIGPPPAGVAELRAWNARLLAEVQWLSINGEIGTELAASIRANGGAIDRALPPAPPVKPDDQDEDEDEVDGPELVEVTFGDGLRGG
jgi:hypothetical protein